MQIIIYFDLFFWHQVVLIYCGLILGNTIWPLLTFVAVSIHISKCLLSDLFYASHAANCWSTYWLVKFLFHLALQLFSNLYVYYRSKPCSWQFLRCTCWPLCFCVFVCVGFQGQDFDWADYLKQCEAEAAPQQCFPPVSFSFCMFGAKALQKYIKCIKNANFT